MQLMWKKIRVRQSRIGEPAQRPRRCAAQVQEFVDRALDVGPVEAGVPKIECREGLTLGRYYDRVGGTIKAAALENRRHEAPDSQSSTVRADSCPVYSRWRSAM